MTTLKQINPKGTVHSHAAGRDLTRLASVASFFVSRVDTEIDHRLDAIGMTTRPQ